MLREYSEAVPKPMVPIGHRPILWHIMKYYAHFGHKDFVLCLGYKSAVIKDYFLNYEEWVSNDFVLSNGGRDSSSSTATSTTGRSPSSTPGCTPTSVSDSRRSNPTWRARRCSWPTTQMGLRIFTSRPTWISSSSRTRRPASWRFDLPSRFMSPPSGPTGGLVSASTRCARPDCGSTGASSSSSRRSSRTSGRVRTLSSNPSKGWFNCANLRRYEYEGYWAVMDTFNDKQALDDLYER